MAGASASEARVKDPRVRRMLERKQFRKDAHRGGIIMLGSSRVYGAPGVEDCIRDFKNVTPEKKHAMYVVAADMFEGDVLKTKTADNGTITK